MVKCSDGKANSVNLEHTTQEWSGFCLYLFIYLFIQYFQRVAPLASLASLPSGPL